MKHAIAAKVIAALISSQAILGVEAHTCGASQNALNAFMTWAFGDSCDASSSGQYLAARRRRKLEEGVVGHVVMGNYGDGEIFVATNATNFPQGVTNGTLIVGVSDWEECNPDAHGRASEFQFEDPVTFNVNELGMIEGEKGWHAQPIRELEGNSTMPVSLAELVSGSGSEYVLAVYLLSSDEELLGCAFLKKHDENTAAEYNALLFGSSQDQEAVKVKENSSSGSKIGLLVSAIAAVGFAFVLGDLFAL